MCKFFNTHILIPKQYKPTPRLSLYSKCFSINPFTPWSDKNGISPYNSNTV